MRPVYSIVMSALLLAQICSCKHTKIISAPATTLPTPTSLPIAPAITDTVVPVPEPPLLPVVGPEPSSHVAAFYYPWYHNPEVDGYWDHWGEGNFSPPLDISSDYYPSLGAYSVADPAIVAQHMAWLREAGVGVIISSWWGFDSREDKAVSLLLDMAERYSIKIAFHLEPYGGRTADKTINDVITIYSKYGNHPAFFYTNETSRWSLDDRAKGLFFLWASRYPDMDSSPVDAAYWRHAIDAIHSLPNGGIILSDENEAEWIDDGHFDGLYSYGVLDSAVEQGYEWAKNLPPDSWFVPGVNPGFSGVRIGLPDSVDTPRRDGKTYHDRWESALSTGVKPQLVAITTFNEWHEGTQIEPAAGDATNTHGYTYLDYGQLPPDGYIKLTRQWVDKFLDLEWPEQQRLRIKVTTTSDWTTLTLISGATWSRHELFFISDEAGSAGFQKDAISLSQQLENAEAGSTVEVIIETSLDPWENAEEVMFEIERGHLGSTEVTFYKNVEGAWIKIDSLEWGGIFEGRNVAEIDIPTNILLGETP